MLSDCKPLACLRASCHVLQLPGLSTALTFNSEANIAAAMERYGALACSFDVYQSFMSWGRSSSGAKTGDVYRGKTGSSDRKSGGHAVIPSINMQGRWVHGTIIRFRPAGCQRCRTEGIMLDEEEG